MFHYAKQVFLLWNLTEVETNTILANTLSLVWVPCDAFLLFPNIGTFLYGGDNPLNNLFSLQLLLCLCGLVAGPGTWLKPLWL